MSQDPHSKKTARKDIHDQLVKWLFLANGGGALALMTFVSQALVSDHGLKVIVPWIIVSLFLMATGVAIAASINYAREQCSKYLNHWCDVSRFLMFSSLWCFVSSILIFVFGLVDFISI